MTKQTKITCDNCASDLTASYNCMDYRIKVEDERMPCKSLTPTMKMVEPSLKMLPLHFCNIGCLRNWVGEG